MRFYITWLLTICVALFACKKDSKLLPKAIDKGNLSGIITDSFNAPLKGAIITIDGTSVKATSADDGSFTLSEATAGKVKVMVALDNYITGMQEVEVVKDQTTKVTFKLKSGKSFLTADKSDYILPSDSTAQTITVKSNSAWTAASSVAWLKLSETSGEGSKAISFILQPNKTPDERSTYIRLTNGADTALVYVNQDSPIMLLSKGDEDVLLPDSITLGFNKPITVTKITADYQNCISSLKYRYLNGDKGVRFQYGCASLCSAYTFSITVKDRRGLSATMPFKKEYYTYKTVMPGRIVNFWVTDDNQTCWMAIQKGDVIIGPQGNGSLMAMSLKDFKIIKEYPLPKSIVNFTYNAYNKAFYVLTNEPLILKVDPATGNVLKQIPINKLPEDNQIYPEIYPGSINFADNGYGILTCGALKSSGESWRVIESDKDDAMSVHPLRKTQPMLTVVTRNDFDKKYLYLRYPYSLETFILNAETRQTTPFTIPVTGGTPFIVTNKKNNKAFFIQTYEQYIYDFATKAMSKLSYFGHGGLGEFSYRENDEDIIYFFDADKRFNVLNFKNATTLLQFPSSLRDMYYRPIATTDGKLLLVRQDEQFYAFNTSMFPRANSKTSVSKNAFLR